MRKAGTYLVAAFTVKKIVFVILLLTAVLTVAWLFKETVPVFNAEGSLNGVLISLDAGHGGFDGGAQGASGVHEDELNLAVTKVLRDELIARGAGVVLTREDGDALADTKYDDMAKRRDIVKQSGADILVSIHMNKFFETQVCGPQVFYMSASDNGKRLAEYIQERLNEIAPQSKKRTALTGDYFMLRSVDATAVIVECGFLSNAAEENLLRTEEYRKKLAGAIADGISSYVSSDSDQKIPPNGSQE